MEHVLTMANLKLKPSLFTPRPIDHNLHCFFLIQALFMAYGPAFKQNMVVEPFQNIELYNLMCGKFLSVYSLYQNISFHCTVLESFNLRKGLIHILSRIWSGNKSYLYKSNSLIYVQKS